jgi:DNA-binding NarL/FixJ family response regulator
MSPHHILIIADDPLVRAGLVQLLDDSLKCQIIGQIHSEELIDFLDDAEPEAIIWDVGWTTADRFPDWSEVPIPIIALLNDAADAAVVWSAGIQALLNRLASADKLIAAIDSAVQGLLTFDPTLAQSLLPAQSLMPVPIETLTPREIDVLQLLAEGLTNKAIAQRLDISDHTVKFHVNAIMSKLEAQSRTEAVVRATQQGLIVL